MRPALVPLLALLAACSTTTPPGRAPDSAASTPGPVVPPAPAAPATLQSAFGIDGQAVSCRAIDLYVGDHTRTRFLRLHVDKAALGLRAGLHEIDLASAGAAVSVEVVVFDAPNPELPDCSDNALAQPGVRERWMVSGGHLTLGISRDVPEGQNFDATVALHGAQFRGPAGAVRTIDADLGRVATGWLPG